MFEYHVVLIGIVFGIIIVTTIITKHADYCYDRFCCFLSCRSARADCARGLIVKEQDFTNQAKAT